MQYVLKAHEQSKISNNDAMMHFYCIFQLELRRNDEISNLR